MHVHHSQKGEATKCPSTDECINPHSGIIPGLCGRKDFVTRAATRVNSEDITLREMGQSREGKYMDSTSLRNSETGRRMQVTRADGEGEGAYPLVGESFRLGRWKFLEVDGGDDCIPHVDVLGATGLNA